MVRRLETSTEFANTDRLTAQARLAAIVQSSDDAIISKTLDGTILTWNEAAEWIYGYTAEEAIGQSISIIIPPERDDELKEILSKLERGEHIRHFETVRMSKSGRRRDISLTISPLHDTEGQVIGASAIGRDITNRKQLERKRARQEFVLRDVLEHAPVGIQWLTQDGRILWANQALMDMVQRQPEEYIGLLANEFYADSGQATDLLYRLRNGETVRDAEVQLRCADGSTIEVLISANVLMEDEEFIHARLFVIDITRRKRIEQHLRESEARFHAMADDAPVLIWMSGPDKKRTFFNARWLDFTGRSMEQELGDGWAQGLHPLDLDRCLSIYDSSFDARNTCEMEYRLHRFDGRYRWVLDTGTPRFTPDGTFLGFIGSCIDITERKEAEALLEDTTQRQARKIKRENKRRRRMEHQLQQQQSQLAHFARVATMGEMASGLAHELNQPLCAIVNFTEACLSTLESTGRNGGIRDNLAQIAAQAERAGEVIRRLREFIRRKTPTVDQVDVNELVLEVIELANSEIRNRDTSVSVQRLPHSVFVLADKIQIQQVILNLIRNGLDAMEHVPKNQRELLVAIKMHGNREVTVSVADRGYGLEREEADKLFEPFFSTKANGMGMGLPISRSIIEAHDGALWVEPRREGGSVFVFTLPTAEVPPDDS